MGVGALAHHFSSAPTLSEEAHHEAAHFPCAHAKEHHIAERVKATPPSAPHHLLEL